MPWHTYTYISRTNNQEKQLLLYLPPFLEGHFANQVQCANTPPHAKKVHADTQPQPERAEQSCLARMYVPKENGGVVDVQLVNEDELMHVDCFLKC